jgi:hypothetical protein
MSYAPVSDTLASGTPPFELPRRAAALMAYSFFEHTVESGNVVKLAQPCGFAARKLGLLGCRKEESALRGVILHILTQPLGSSAL